MPVRMTEIVMHVTDLATETAFWRDTIGLTPIRDSGKYVLFDLGGPRLELSEQGPGFPAIENQSQLTFSPILQVDDVEGVLATALANGGRQLGGVRVLPGIVPEAKVVYVASPAGLCFGLVQGDEEGYRAGMGQRPLPEYWS